MDQVTHRVSSLEIFKTHLDVVLSTPFEFTLLSVWVGSDDLQWRFQPSHKFSPTPHSHSQEVSKLRLDRAWTNLV